MNLSSASHLPEQAASVTVIIISHNEAANLRQTVQSILSGLPADGEIIVVDDLSTDGSADTVPNTDSRVVVLRSAERLGAAPARNWGVQHARGNMFVFSDAHMEVPTDWAKWLLEPLACSEVGAVGPVVSVMGRPTQKGYGFRWSDPQLNTEWLPAQQDQPYAVPMLGSCFLAMRRDVFEQCGGFDSGLLIWGMEDAELSLRLWSLGYECLLTPRLDVSHLFRSGHPYALNWEILIHNILRVAVVHFGTERLSRVVEAFRSNAAFPTAFARLAVSPVWAYRDTYRAARRYDDDWFFRKFNLVF